MLTFLCRGEVKSIVTGGLHGNGRRMAPQAGGSPPRRAQQWPWRPVMVEHARQLQRFCWPDAVGDHKGPCLGIAHLPLQHQTHGFPGFLTTQARAGAPARGSWDGSGAAAFATGAGGPWPHWRSDSRRIADLGRGLAATPGSPSAAPGPDRSRTGGGPSLLARCSGGRWFQPGALAALTRWSRAH